MKYPVYAWRDTKVGFGALHVEANEDTAKRNFGYELNRADSIMEYAATDYELYQIAEYDTKSGHIEGLELPLFIVNGADMIGVK